MIEALAFYIFSSIAVAAAFMVISARNPVHSVLFLILTFFNVAGMFVILGAEFLAMILVVVYVGAVAVLFMFVVMMLDINFVELRQGFLNYLPIGSLIGLVMLIELATLFGSWVVTPVIANRGLMPTPSPDITTNTHALGNIVYTHYVYLFQAAGMILLVAMIGAIVLTHRNRPGVKKQDIGRQLNRNPANSVEIRKVEIGKGI
ncbi:MAG: NADH:ubiquinone oxidoreductase subunit J [Rhodospirillaceae bacterium TMED8]|nr:NADH:ubiquinone oxidoreductase subunit J [Magnetovibrio sp.]OUT51689.1 MAG: NADH:ubiquinone oxidoreductase subunit J [Rhodospirillaceae bacterium TMED8]|tara:strand:+ start:279 stop:890 length:612 start_codon:yes stop_codon:yes gene_type:complete